MAKTDFSDKNVTYDFEDVILKYPSVSNLDDKYIRMYRKTIERNNAEWCPVCTIQYSTKKYQQCPLCKFNKENHELRSKIEDMEYSIGLKERQYIDYINEILSSKDNNSGTSGNKVKKTMVTFGRYRGFPINWLIICTDRMNGKVLLISEKAFDMVRYNAHLIDVAWEDSTLRMWLNEKFFDEIFDESEKKLVKLTNVINNGGQNTEYRCSKDFMFCLSADEVKGYFKKDKYRIAWGLDGQKVRWWLRGAEQGSKSSYVGNTGKIAADELWVTEMCAIRPALWVDISYVETTD